MKKTLTIIIVFLLMLAGAGYWYWQNDKNRIIKDLIQHTINDKTTDSTYYIKYDSISIDHKTGNAYFGNVSLQSDSIQEIILKSSDNLSNLIINIHIKSVTALGIDISVALLEKKLIANKIIIDNPNIILINTGKYQLSKQDTLALYQKLIGKFKSIQAETVEIIQANIITKNNQEEIAVEIKNANFNVSHLAIDSTKDYSNIFSYFIQNATANIDSIYINRPFNESALLLKRLQYDAYAKGLLIEEVSSLKEGKTEEKIQLNQLRFEEINIQDFVENHIINVGKISTYGGMLTIFSDKLKPALIGLPTNASFDFPDDFFEEIKMGAINIDKTTLIIRTKENPRKEPLILKNVNFSLSDTLQIPDHYTLRQLLDNAQWKMTTDGFSLKTKDNNYTISVNGIKINKSTSNVSIAQLLISPNLKQKDYYNITMKDINLQKVNLNKLIHEKTIEIEQADLNLDMRAFNDRISPLALRTKNRKSSPEKSLKDNFPLYIHKLGLHDSYLSYQEKSLQSQKIGNIEINKVNATMENYTNIPSYIKKNPICGVKGSGMLLNTTKIAVSGRMPLNSSNNQVELEGIIEKIDFSAFNQVTIPLINCSVSGMMNELAFTMTTDDYGAKGNMRILYNNLNVEPLTSDIGKKTMINVLSNHLIRKDNPSNGKTETTSFEFKKDPNMSFFDYVIKSLFEGVKNTFLGKKG